ncbi:hypothetical protein [Actinomadura terrae]|uniref:hypothetical protein n=1 Tax=Actinomadura terrae TaxID=604353 RepID=UPI001FA78A2E|nr:hypothetical protein [Actinomadura terrae]
MRKTGLPTLEDYANEHEARGEARGEAKSVLLVLEARGVPVSDGVRERISACMDLDQLERWVKRATSVEAAEELFI